MSFFFCPHTMVCGFSYCRDTCPRVSVKTVWKQRTPREGCPYDVNIELNIRIPRRDIPTKVLIKSGNGTQAVPLIMQEIKSEE